MVVPGQAPVGPGQGPVLPGQAPEVPGLAPVGPGLAPVVLGLAPVVPGQALPSQALPSYQAALQSWVSVNHHTALIMHPYIPTGQTHIPPSYSSRIHLVWHNLCMVLRLMPMLAHRLPIPGVAYIGTLQ